MLHSRFICTKSLADLEADLRYGTFDFIVEGPQAIRHVFQESVLLLHVELSSGQDAQGTAFAVLPNLLVTARHCVEGTTAVRVIVPGGEVSPFKIILPATNADVAGLLLTQNLALPAFKVREPEFLEPVLTMGYPRLQGLHPALMCSAGELSGKATAYLDGEDYWVTTCSMTGGSSGGPVVGSDGCVVGVVAGLPAAETGIDPGRFGLMSQSATAMRLLADSIATGGSPQ